MNEEEYTIVYRDSIVGVNNRLIYNRRIRKFILSNEYRRSKKKLFTEVKKIFPNQKPSEKKVRIEIQIPKKNKQDIDACIKPILDSLESIFYKNDRQVDEVIARKSDIDHFFIKVFLKK